MNAPMNHLTDPTPNGMTDSTTKDGGAGSNAEDESSARRQYLAIIPHTYFLHPEVATVRIDASSRAEAVRLAEELSSSRAILSKMIGISAEETASYRDLMELEIPELHRKLGIIVGYTQVHDLTTISAAEDLSLPSRPAGDAGDWVKWPDPTKPPRHCR